MLSIERLLDAAVRILHIHKITGISGSERHLLSLLPALRERGVDARFLGLDVPGTDAARVLRGAGRRGRPVPACPLHVRREPSHGRRRRQSRAPRRAGPAPHPPRARGHLRLDRFPTRQVCRSSPHVTTTTATCSAASATSTECSRGGPGRIIAISDAVRGFLERAGLPRAKLVTVHYGLDALPGAASEVTPAELGVRPDAPLLLAIGRLIAQKDHATLLRAFAGVRAAHPEAVLAILGAGPLEAETRQLVTSLRLDDAVLLPGRLETRDWLERADVFVHTSRWEGFGIVLLEAMLAGLPIVATRVSAVPEVVVGRSDGRPCRAGRCRRALERPLALLDDRRSRPRARARGPRARSHGVLGRQRWPTARWRSTMLHRSRAR